MAKGEYPAQLKIAKVIALYKRGRNITPEITDQYAYYRV